MHPMFYIGGTLVLMMVGYWLFTTITNGVATLSNQWTYGYPRTYQTDKDAGHGGMSHFIVVNVQGHIHILEIITDAQGVSKSKIYGGPVLSGPGADFLPATITFDDVNHDGLPEMILTIVLILCPKRHVDSLLDELGDWYEEGARILLSGVTDKVYQGFVYVRWDQPMPDAFKNKLRTDASIEDYFTLATIVPIPDSSPA
jgi:hypothetical protein